MQNHNKYQEEKRLFHKLIKSERSLKDRINEKTRKIKKMSSEHAFSSELIVQPYHTEQSKRAIINKGYEKLNGWITSVFIIFSISFIIALSLVNINFSPFLISAEHLSEVQLQVCALSIAISTVLGLVLIMSYLVKSLNGEDSYFFKPIKMILKGILNGELIYVIPLFNRYSAHKNNILNEKNQKKLLKKELRKVRSEINNETIVLRNKKDFIEQLENDYDNFGNHKKLVFKVLLD